MRLRIAGASALVCLGWLTTSCTANTADSSGSGTSTAGSAPATGSSTSPAACTGTPVADAAARAAVPAGFPTPAAWVPVTVVTQGRARVVHGWIAGGTADIVATRDRALAALTGAGYRSPGADQEPGFEAEAEFEGQAEGSITVRAQCAGYLDLAYTFDR